MIFHLCLFKDLQEVAYPKVHPHTEVSRDLEFMGTRSSFPTPVSSHPPLHLNLQPVAATSATSFDLRFFYPPPRSHFRHLAPFTLFQISFWTSQLTGITTFLLLFLAPSPPPILSPLFLLNQLNCYPPLHLRVCSVISRLHHVSVQLLSFSVWISYITRACF